MAEPGTISGWHCLPDAAAVAAAALAIILGAAKVAIAARGVFRMVLAGGTTPDRVYRLLASSSTDWNRWQIYFGDERCLPVNDPERNSRLAAGAWLERVSIPAANVHPIPAELGTQAAALAYAPLVEAARPFDLVLLGMGEDGHTASLFPGHVHPPREAVHAVSDAPKPPPERVSLSRESLSDSRDVLILVTGTGKRAAVRQWRNGANLPVAGITALERLNILLDRDAAGETALC